MQTQTAWGARGLASWPGTEAPCCNRRAWTQSCGVPVHCSESNSTCSGTRSHSTPNCSGRVPAPSRQWLRRVCAVRAEQPAHQHHRRQRNSSSNGHLVRKQYDVLALNNICIDVIVPQAELPGPDPIAREQLLQQLSASPPSESSWELGANCNVMVAAARLGLRAGAVGHVGTDAYGRFLNRLLQEEHIPPVITIAPADLPAELNKTLVCFVLVDPHGRHAFTSRYDFGPWPLLQGIEELPPRLMQALSQTHAVFMNGFVFDELPLKLVKTAARAASRAGAAVFFDPGPRCFTMRTGSRRVALDTMLDLSDVVLMTQDEAAEVTGCSDAVQAACSVLGRSGARTQWCVVKLGAQGAVLVTKKAAGGTCAQHFSPGMQVDVSDTVGCGDSFAAAVVLGYIRQHSIQSTLALANAVGGATAMGRGAGRNVATADRVATLLQQASAADSADAADALDILRASLDGAADAPDVEDPQRHLAAMAGL